MYIHVFGYKHTHKYTHTCKHTQTHTHTHTHTLRRRCLPSAPGSNRRLAQICVGNNSAFGTNLRLAGVLMGGGILKTRTETRRSNCRGPTGITPDSNTSVCHRLPTGVSDRNLQVVATTPKKLLETAASDKCDFVRGACPHT